MRIMILHMRFHPDLTGTGPLVTDLAADLVEMGNEVTVVTSMPHYGRHEIPAEYRGRLLHRSNFNGIDLWRTYVYVPPNPSGFQRSINYLSYTFMSIVAGLMANKPDVILCVNPPITVGFSGWLLSLARRARLVFNVQDIWPDCLVIIDQLRSPLLTRIFKYLEKFIYRVSSRVTVLSQGMKENLTRKGVPDEKVVVIPNWANVETIRPVERENSFRVAHGLNGEFVVMFAGNLGFIAMLERVLEAAKLLENEPHIQFLIVGEGNAKAGLVNRASELGLKNVRFLPTQPKEVLPEMLGAADLSLVTLNRQLGQLNVPSKTYSIMASARPVLASVPEDSEIARLVEVADCGVGVPPEDPFSLAHAIRHLSRQPEKLRLYGVNGRRYVEKYLTRRRLTTQYHNLLHQIVKSDASSHIQTTERYTER
ncbi:MAG: glycosyltransferase family 4 protein [Acidobacteria bacterium]|nr:glycosyltransferase family 4 protein [Acidobacteriota bacterium]